MVEHTKQYDPVETQRRLGEIGYSSRFTNRAECLRKAINRKSGALNTAETSVLNSFPDDGIDIGFISNALIYAPALNAMSKQEHCAVISLMRLGKLGISYTSGAYPQYIIKL